MEYISWETDGLSWYSSGFWPHILTENLSHSQLLFFILSHTELLDLKASSISGGTLVLSCRLCTV